MREVGDKVKVIKKNKYGHDFQIGELVEIVEIDLLDDLQYKCKSNNRFWWLNEEEIQYNINYKKLFEKTLDFAVKEECANIAGYMLVILEKAKKR